MVPSRIHQAFAGQVPVDVIEDPARQVVLFEHTTELEQCRGVRRRLVRQVDADKAANGLDVLDRFFFPLVRQALEVLRDVFALHPL